MTPENRITVNWSIGGVIDPWDYIAEYGNMRRTKAAIFGTSFISTV